MADRVSSVLSFAKDVLLAPYTTLRLGGPARYFGVVSDEAELVQALSWADAKNLEVVILGGGSNVVVADEGFPGLVLQIAMGGIEREDTQEGCVLTVQAGECWDRLVDATVDDDLAGLECLAGIPGRVGAAPVQNIGAYGCEVGERIVAVKVLDRETLETRYFDRTQCAFAYRDSLFKREANRYVVLSVRLLLEPHGAPSVRYPELAQALAGHAAGVSLQQVRDQVRVLRAKKSMLLGGQAERVDGLNSAGSFFTNPIVSREQVESLLELAVAMGLVEEENEVPRYPTDDGRVKLPAAWLIERSGIVKGYRKGSVGVSDRHTLALVHHGGGTTKELVELALEIRATVLATFGIVLKPEPVRVGFEVDPFAKGSRME